MQLWQPILVAVVSYLLGSINGALMVSQTFLKVDIRNYGSGNAGTTNAFRVMGKKWAFLVTMIDLCKGAVAVTFGYFVMAGMAGDGMGKLLAGVFAIVGHIFPVFYKFKGGKGVMTTAAIIAFVDWRVFIIVLSLFIVLVILTRWVSLGSILATIGVPIGIYFFHRNDPVWPVYVALSSVITLMIVIMHRENIKRILDGTESRFSFKGRAVLDTVKTKTANITHKTSAAVRKTTHNIHTKATNFNRNHKKRKYSKKRLRRERRTTRRRMRKTGRPSRERRNRHVHS